MGQLVMDQTVHMKYLYIKSIIMLHVICNKYTIKCNYYIYQNFNHSQVKFSYSTDVFFAPPNLCCSMQALTLFNK